jgi:hypothetical protein
MYIPMSGLHTDNFKLNYAQTIGTSDSTSVPAMP